MGNEELKKEEDALPRLTESDLEKASRLHKAKTQSGMRRIPPKGSLTKETRREVVEFLKKVEQSGKWLQRRCSS